MSALKRTILVCDVPGCRSRFLGDLREAAAPVRRRAKVTGWDSYTTSSDMFRIWIDHCPKHK
jgi:hypothetical protein